MARWGLDGDTLRARNPGLVSCSVTAFGTAEAAAGMPGYDFLLQAMGGLMSVTGEEDGPPLKVGAAVVDLVCGLHAVVGIQAALAERARTGRGGHVEVSLMDAALAGLLNQGAAWVLGGTVPTRRGNRHPSIAPYETLRAADRPLAVAVGNDRMFGRLCQALGLEALPADERFATNRARVEHAAELAAELEAVLATRTAADWIATLRAASVPAGPINDVAEAYALAEALDMEPVCEVDGVPLPAPPLRIDGERPPVRRPPPRLDQHGPELRAWLEDG
jgi:crotonobetainyl-CoA:carnitine CoA-transferase CaiB-like acyl-CoA transferase